jgi:carbon-monoxide dehydrogenase medium subunit
VPAMALRLARPSHLIDINRIQALRRLEFAGDALHIGACVRHIALATPVEPGPLGRLLSTVVRHIAHLPIRTRGTFCGSLANADGASEWCLVVTTLNATLIAQSTRGRREIPASEFFVGFMTTALEPDEILTEAVLPGLPSATRFGFEEISRRAGDFAQAMCLAVFEMDGGLMRRVRIGLGGVSGTAVRATQAEAACEGKAPDEALFTMAATLASAEIHPVDASDDARDYRRALAHTVVTRALAQAAG